MGRRNEKLSQGFKALYEITDEEEALFDCIYKREHIMKVIIEFIIFSVIAMLLWMLLIKQ